MALRRDDPYAQFNFLVSLGAGDTASVEAGFQECSQVSTTVDVIEYRNGNEKHNGVRKITGLERPGDVTLKRGIIGVLNLYEWFDSTRGGERDVRDVVIQLQNEDHSAVVMTWHLMRTRVIRYATGPLHARGTEVALEELVLSCERILAE